MAKKLELNGWEIHPPTLTITRKKSGGKINSWEIID